MLMLYRKINFKYKEYILFVGFIIFFIYLHIQNNKMLYETFQSLYLVLYAIRHDQFLS